MSIALRFRFMLKFTLIVSFMILTTGCSATSWLYLGDPASSTPPAAEEDSELVLATRDFIVAGAISSQVTLNNGNKVFGGNFSNVLKPIGACYKYATSSQEFSSLCMLISEQIYAIESDGADGYYIGGNNGYLLHMKANGTFYNWRPVLTYTGGRAVIKSLKLHAGVLYVGGVFSYVGGEARKGLAAFDITTGQLTSWNPGLQENPAYNYLRDPYLVVDMTVAGSQLFVLGAFLGGGQNAVSSPLLISLNLSDSNADPNFVLDSSLVTLVPSKLYYVRGALLVGNLLMNPADGSSIDMNLQAGIGGGGLSISGYDVDGDTLWLVGDFTSLGGVTTTNVAAFDLSGISFSTAPTIQSWSNTLSVPDHRIASIHAANGTLLVSGPFEDISGTSVPGFAFLNASDGSLKTQPLYEFDIDSEPLVSLGKVNGDLFLLGSFSKSYERNNLFMVDADNILLPWDPNVDGTVFSLSTDGTTVFVGGRFSEIGQNALPRENLAQVDAAGNATAMVSDTDDDVMVLKYHNSVLYAGGYFTEVNGAPLGALAKIDPSSGAAQPVVSNTLVDGTSIIWGLEFIGDKLIVAGLTVNSYIFAYDLTAGSVVAGWNPNLDDVVTKMTTTADGQIIIAGDFTEVDGVARSGLAKLSLSSSAPDAAWAPVLTSDIYRLDFLEVVDNTVVIYGRRQTSPRPFSQFLDLNTGLDTTFDTSIVPSGIVPM